METKNETVTSEDRTGRTTAICLDILATAMKEPGKAVQVYDHDRCSDAQADWVARRVLLMAEKLGLDGFVKSVTTDVLGAPSATITYHSPFNK